MDATDLSTEWHPDQIPGAVEEDLETTTLPEDLLILPSGPISNSESAEKIFERISGTRTLFSRGGCVVEVDGNGREPILSVLRPEELVSRLERYGKLAAWRVERDGKLVLKKTRCPIMTARILLATLEAKCLPGIASIMRGPVCIAEGREIHILHDGWHDVQGGLLVHGSTSIDDLDIAEASQILGELLEEFTFVSENDRSRAIAALISPALRTGGIFPGPYPFTVIEADDSQTGKGYLCALIFAIYGETPGLVGDRKGGVGSLDESIAQKLIEGRPFIQLDNLRDKIDSTYLEMILTAAGPVPARIPHRGEIQVDPASFSFFATSNGVSMTKDLANRSNIIRLTKRRDYRFRGYPEGDLLEHVHANRGRFLGAIFEVVRAYVEAGKPRTDDLRGQGGFRHWWQTMDWILQNLLHQAPPLDGHDDAQQRTANPVLTWLREVCLICEREARLNEEISATTIVEICEEHGLPIPGVKGDGEGANKTVGLKLGLLFRESPEVTIDRWQVIRTEREECTPSRRMKPMKFYRVVIRGQNPPPAGGGPNSDRITRVDQGDQVQKPCENQRELF